MNLKMYEPNCYLDVLYKLQKQVCRTVGPILANFFESLAHCQNIANASPSYGYNLVDFYSTWLNQFFLIFVGGPLVSLKYCMVFLLPLQDAEYVNSFFLHTASEFQSRVNKHLLSFYSHFVIVCTPIKGGGSLTRR